MRLRQLISVLSLTLATAFGCGGAGTPAATTPESPAPAVSGTESGAPPAVAVAVPEGRTADNLIPREVLFGNPERANVQLSPNGKHISWTAPSNGVMNVFVAPVGALDQAKAITADTKRPVRMYQWAYDGAHILYSQDAGGDENFHVFSVDVATGKAIDLTPQPNVQAQILDLSEKFPTTVLVQINDRKPELHDIWKMDLVTGKGERVVENPGFVGFITDDKLAVRYAAQMQPDGSIAYQKAGKKAGTWDAAFTIGADDAMTTSPAFIDPSGKTLYMMDSRERDTGAMVAMDIASGKLKVLAEDPRADVQDMIVHPKTHKIQAVGFTYERRAWKVLDKSIQADLDALAKLPGEIDISSRTLDDKTWLVTAMEDSGPVKFYIYDHKTKKPTYLFSNRPALEKLELTHMAPVVIDARDGLKLVSYLSLPLGADKDGDGKPEAAVPTVLLVHGGPWGRDDWGYNPLHQLLTNRGYAVLSVNFRGSTGFGKKFINAADREWSGKMHDDLIDATEWAIKSGVAPKDKVCIMGGSYGGYSTLVGLTFTPDTFACGVDIVGPSNILTLINSVPPYWKPMLDMFKKRVGDWTTAEGKAKLEAQSPLSRVAAIKRPLLIGQGANDPRVKQAEADQIVKAMKDKGIPVTYVLFADEGHGFARPENNMAFWAVTEAFLSAHLGGVYQPYDKALIGASSMKVPAGAEQVPGLAGAL